MQEVCPISGDSWNGTECSILWFSEMKEKKRMKDEKAEEKDWERGNLFFKR